MNSADPTPSIASECAAARTADMLDLMALAVERGCRHYTAMAQGRSAPACLRSLRHEVLACALMNAPMPGGFDAFRCGAMILSDLSNRKDVLAAAAAIFGVERRIGYVVGLALEHDGEKTFWSDLHQLFPEATDEELPGLSRLVSETGVQRGRKELIRTWLRTRHPAEVLEERIVAGFYGKQKLTSSFRSAKPFLHGGTDSTRTISDERDHAVP